MERCEVCGNIYSKLFSVSLNGLSHKFDCLECAIHLLAPRCHHFGIAIIGHGAEAADIIFCSAHCAREEGLTQLNDHCRTTEPNFFIK